MQYKFQACHSIRTKKSDDENNCINCINYIYLFIRFTEIYSAFSIWNYGQICKNMRNTTFLTAFVGQDSCILFKKLNPKICEG